MEMSDGHSSMDPAFHELRCLIDFCVSFPFSRSPMVVFEVIGQLQ